MMMFSRLPCTFFAAFFFCSILSAQDRVKIHITDVPFWTLRVQDSETNSTLTETVDRPYPMVAKAMRHFRSQKHCKDFAIVLNIEKAHYAFVFGGRTAWDQGNVNVRVIKLNEDQEVVYAGETIRFTNVVKDACKAVKRELDSE